MLFRSEEPEQKQLLLARGHALGALAHLAQRRGDVLLRLGVMRELDDAVERIKSITGRIDLVHCNDSRDAAGSGADRHANFGSGQIDPQLLAAVVRAADAPVICETSEDGRKDDIAFLRENV